MRFQWLKDYQDLEDQILFLKWNLNKSKLELSRWIYGDLSDVRLEKNSRSSSLEKKILIIEQEIERLQEQQREMLAIIQSFKGVENDIVRMKYIEGLTLEQIAEEIDYNSSYIRRKHAEIRSKLEFLDDYEKRYDDRQNKRKEINCYNEQKEGHEQISLF